MANPEHVKILRQGADVWNEWTHTRLSKWALDSDRDTLDKGPELADLSHAQLIGLDLTHAELSTAFLDGADLTGARLSYANLGRTSIPILSPKIWDDIYKVVKNRNDIKDLRCVVGGTILRNAILRGAILHDTDMHRASVYNADFTEAKFSGTRFIDIDLTHVKGLDQCTHQGPSIVDYRTLLQSRRTPTSFWKGCGISDALINYLPSVQDEPLQFYSCFISYSSNDQEFAERLHADLQSKGVRCWFAPEDLKIGDRLRPSFDEAIRVHDKLMVLLSENSVSSPWVEKEVETAFEKERREKRTVLFPIRLDDAVMKTDQAWAADIRRGRHIGDFRNWKNEVHP
ncbi:MAG: toll/interleukin-1 receptor domain-containing protein [Terriglobales bacterium]